MRLSITSRMVALLTVTVLLLGTVASHDVGAESGDPTPLPASVPSFSESWGCGALQGLRGPLAEKPGILDLHVPIYGPWADFYGRTVGLAWEQRRLVTLPNMTGTPKSIWVHERVWPALQAVIANLNAEAAKGRRYWIRYENTWSWSRYTIPPGRAFSFHAVGAALDINSNTNPYRTDNVLITDMPTWFVDAWRDAGWCWGGDWITVKDPMHFSWMGPLHTDGYVMPPPQPPLVGPASFASERTLPVAFPAPPPGARHLIADLDRDGAADVVRVEPHAGDRLRLIIAVSRFWYRATNQVGVTETAPTDGDAPIALADMNRDGRPDLVYVLDGGGTVSLEVFTFTGGGSMPRSTIATAVPYEDGAVYLFADHDRDGHSDLYVIRPGNPATLEVWAGPTFTATAVTAGLGFSSAGRRFALGERTVDGIPDLFALADNGTVTVRTGASGYSSGTSTSTNIDPTGEDLFVFDLDGDGYGDLLLLRANGATRMRRGGASTHSPGIWFVQATHTVSRLQGQNRYGTAATASGATHQSPSAIDTVYVATGMDFPDALAGAAVAGLTDAPLLLVGPNSVTTATRAELTRLAPSTIVILGGTDVVSPAVETALGQYGTTLRLAGDDRYGTAVALSRHAFPTDGSGPPVVIATGEDFPDALTAGPAAAALGGPVLLTRADELPEVTREELLRLDPSHIVVVGGTTAVSEAVVAELNAIAPVERIAGSNRYATAVAVSKAVFADADRVYLATGRDFPDALAGAAAAAARNAPLLLVPGTTLPTIVAAEIERLDVTSILILGGTLAVSSSVANAASLIGL